MKHYQRILLLVAGAILLAISPFLLTVGWQQRQDALDTMRGEIAPVFEFDPAAPIYVELGGLGNYFNTTELDKGIDLTRLFHWQQANQTFSNFPVKISLFYNRISVSAEIKNSNNLTIARVIDNNWATASPDTLLIWDRNYNAYAFEVIDSNKIPVLQILLTGKNKVLIGCNLFQQGIPAYFTLTNGFSFFSDGNVPEKAIQNLRSSTIFEYPSETHLGEMRDDIDSLVELPPLNESPFPESLYPLNSPLSNSNWIILAGIVTSIIGSIFIGIFGAQEYKSKRRKTMIKKIVIELPKKKVQR